MAASNFERFRGAISAGHCLSRRGTPASLACVNWRAGGTVLQALIPLDIGGTQIRQARELLGWPASYLALRAKISTAAIDRAETGGGKCGNGRTLASHCCGSGPGRRRVHRRCHGGVG